MSEYISKKKIAAAILLPFLLTLLSLNFESRDNPLASTTLESSRFAKFSRSGICIEHPDADTKAGFPIAFLYEDDRIQEGGSSPNPSGGIYKRGGGPFALLSPAFNGLDGQMSCNRIDGAALAADFVFYVGLTIGFGVIRSRMRHSGK
jgi:hypothetical protein